MNSITVAAAEAVRYRLRRVDLLVRQLGDSIQSWGSNLCFQTNVHEDCQGWDVYVDHPNGGLVDEWTSLYSESIHHLRCALDNMVWSLATPAALTAGQQNRIGFPILSDESRWGDAVRTNLRTVPSVFVDRVYDTQPFDVKPSSAASPLAGLQNLSNADKHRLRVQASIADESLKINAAFTWPGDAFGTSSPLRSEPKLIRHEWRPGNALNHSVRTDGKFRSVEVACALQGIAIAETLDGSLPLTDSLLRLLMCVANTAQWVTGETIMPFTQNASMLNHAAHEREDRHPD